MSGSLDPLIERQGANDCLVVRVEVLRIVVMQSMLLIPFSQGTKSISISYLACRIVGCWPLAALPVGVPMLWDQSANDPRRKGQTMPST